MKGHGEDLYSISIKVCMQSTGTVRNQMRNDQEEDWLLLPKNSRSFTLYISPALDYEQPNSSTTLTV